MLGISISQEMEKALFRLFSLINKNEDYKFYHVTNFTSSEKLKLYFTLTKYWGLIESLPNPQGNIKPNEFWRLTDKGYLFLKGEITIPKFMYITNGNIVGASTKHVKVSKALKPKLAKNIS